MILTIPMAIAVTTPGTALDAEVVQWSYTWVHRCTMETGATAIMATMQENKILPSLRMADAEVMELTELVAEAVEVTMAPEMEVAAVEETPAEAEETLAAAAEAAAVVEVDVEDVVDIPILLLFQTLPKSKFLYNLNN